LHPPLQVHAKKAKKIRISVDKTPLSCYKRLRRVRNPAVRGQTSAPAFFGGCWSVLREVRGRALAGGQSEKAKIDFGFGMI
jgi:hypothetical protein